MTDDTRTIELGKQAAESLDDPATAEGFARLEADLIAAWRASRPQDRDARERIYLRLGALDAIRQELRLMREEGRLAQREGTQANEGEG